jgi:hypothetical protein
MLEHVGLGFRFRFRVRVLSQGIWAAVVLCEKWSSVEQQARVRV